MSHVVLTTASTSPWTVPAGVSSVTVYCIGSGGNGGTGGYSSGLNTSWGGGGGGAGACAWATLSVTAGNNINFNVGAAGGTVDTWFNGSALVAGNVVAAYGGNSGFHANAGAGGTTANSFGAGGKFAGGSGGVGTSSTGNNSQFAGGGGGAATYNVAGGTGGDGSGTQDGGTGGGGASGGTAPSGSGVAGTELAGGVGAGGGGAGGNATSSINAGNGGNYGAGGGGGGHVSGGSSGTGGSATDGVIVIVYSASHNVSLNAMSLGLDPFSISSKTEVNVSLNAMSFGVDPFSVSRQGNYNRSTTDEFGVAFNDSETGHYNRSISAAMGMAPGTLSSFRGPIPFVQKLQFQSTVQTATIPSYLYVQYNDDDNLQAFVQSYNGMTQAYVDWFSTVNIANYPTLSGLLLDWIGQGLYGFTRPVFASVGLSATGPVGTFVVGTLVLGTGMPGTSSTYTTATDDIYARCLTWQLYKGDGNYFTIPWLKYRILRFLYGNSGTDVSKGAIFSVSVQLPDNILSIGTGNGSQTSFAEPSGWNAGAHVYKDDWQGNQLQYSTPRTNVLLNSNGFTASNWLNDNCTITANATTGPDGVSNTGTKLEVATTSNPNIYDNGYTVPATAPLSIAGSVWVLAGNISQVIITPYQNGHGGVNATAYVISGPGSVSGSGGDVLTFSGLSKTQWTHVGFITTGTIVPSAKFNLYIKPQNGTINVGDYVYIAYGEEEVANYLASYIPTTTSPVTVTDYSLSGGNIIFSLAPETGAVLTAQIAGTAVNINVSAASGVPASVLSAFQYSVQGGILSLPPTFTYSVTI